MQHCESSVNNFGNFMKILNFKPLKFNIVNDKTTYFIIGLIPSSYKEIS